MSAAVHELRAGTALAALAMRQWTMYPDGNGHYALGSPDGQVLCPDEAIAIYVGGQWIEGNVIWESNGDYFLAADRSICGLYAQMRVCLIATSERSER